MRTTSPRHRGRRSATLALATVLLTVPGLEAFPAVLVAAGPEPVEPAIQAIRLDAGESAGDRVDGRERLFHVADLLESEKIDTKPFQLAALTWDDVERTGTTVWARTRADGRWSSWTELEAGDAPDPDSAEAEQATRGGTEPLIVSESDGVQVRISSDDAALLEGLQIDLVDPGESSTDTTLASAASATTESAGASMPEIYTRAQWGADESIREPGEPDYGQVLGTFVHHTAGTNSYTEADVPAIIRAIYAYHVNGRGWRDIGYNFLVDRFGRIWEGRYGGVDRAVVGAHTAGYNSSAFGTSVLGTYTSKAPEGVVLDAYERLIAWKFTLHGVDPDASVSYPERKTLPAISGHRDADATECPGQLLYDKLGAIRLGTAAAMEAASEDLVVLDQSSGYTRLTSLVTGTDSQLGPGTEWPLTGLRLLTGDLQQDGTGGVTLVRRLAAGGFQLYAVPWDTGGFYDANAKSSWATVSGGGWSFDASRQLMGDVNGDGLDDIVSVHRQSLGGLSVYVHRNTGTSYAAPVLWQELKTGGWSYLNSRQMLADLNGDGLLDLVSSHRQSTGGLHLWAHVSTGSSFVGPTVWSNLRTGGWSYADSRQVAGDVTGDGRDDIVSSHRQSTGGLLLWTHRSTGSALASPALWSDLKSGGWSYDRSRQLIADIDQDGDDDLYSTHRSSTGQFRTWTHASIRTSFQAPSLYRDVLASYYYDGAKFATSRH